MLLALAIAGCGESDVSSGRPTPSDPDASHRVDLPRDRAPEDSSLFTEWLDQGAYLTWKCQAEPHPFGAALPPRR